MYHVIQLYENSGDAKGRHRFSRSLSVEAMLSVQVVKIRIEQNPLGEQNSMPRKMKISNNSMLHIVRENLRLRVYKIRSVHVLFDVLIKGWSEKSKRLLAETCIILTEELPNFTEEKKSLPGKKIFF